MTERERSGIAWPHDLALDLGILVALAGLVLLYCVGCVSSTPDRGVAGRTIEAAITETLSALALRPTATPALSPGETGTSSPPAQTATAANVLELTPTRPITYIVQLGDTLAKIAARFGVTVERIAEANNIEDLDVIEVGQVLTLPQEVAPLSPGVTSTLTTTPRPTEMPPPVAPVPALTFEEQLRPAVEKHALAGADSYEMEYHEAGSGLGAMIYVAYFAELLWDEKSGLRMAAHSLKGLAPALFELDPDLDILNVRYETTFVDKYGQESRHWYVSAQVSRETAENIVWENVLRCNFPDILDVWKVYAPLANAWQELCAE